jgi:hypothetical protein
MVLISYSSHNQKITYGANILANAHICHNQLQGNLHLTLPQIEPLAPNELFGHGRHRIGQHNTIALRKA